MGQILAVAEREALLARHWLERDGRVKDRIKAVLLRDNGLTYNEIARVLFLSEEGVRKQIDDYLSRNAKLKPENGGSSERLSAEQASKLEAHLEETLYLRTCDIVEYVKKTFGIDYSVGGLTKWLHQHGFSYHKPVGVPAKADGDAQKAWIAWYEAFKTSRGFNEKILFMDGVHPSHAVRFTSGWIRKGERRDIPTNGSQRRLNVLGALDLEDMAIYTQDYDAINAEAIIIFLTYLLAIHSGYVVHIILDRARYHTCAAVEAWIAENPRLQLHFLPPYSPHLNTIERVWKLMHEHTVNNTYSPPSSSSPKKSKPSSQKPSQIRRTSGSIGSPTTSRRDMHPAFPTLEERGV
jgi:transposase